MHVFAILSVLTYLLTNSYVVQSVYSSSRVYILLFLRDCMPGGNSNK